jgi:4-amino-4-deoxy-L-arabinose transferase-like glycosyltransferase
MSDSKRRKRRAAPPEAAGDTLDTLRRGAPRFSPRTIRWLVLALVCFVSLDIVLVAFNPAPHTGGDNATYVSLAYSLVEYGTYEELFDPARLPHTIYPPVFPALLAGLMLLGARTWIAFKLVAALSAVAAVAVTFLWAERKVGAAWGFGVALTLALSNALVYYSHWILSDVTFLFFTVLALYASERADEPADGADASSGSRGARWMALGIGAAGLAYFTRSAGLPLLVAFGAWLIVRRRWRTLAAGAAVWSVPILLWFLRGRAYGQDGYREEFWLVDPYDPSKGRVGALGLLQRTAANAWSYVGSYIPTGIADIGVLAGAALGLFVVGLGLAGWTWAVRKRVGPTELFLPLYAGLIALWPEIWSGDRFALPLYPILFLYGARFLKEVRFGRIQPALIGAIACAALILPAAKTLWTSRGYAEMCAAMAQSQGPFGCYGPNIRSFVEVAEWSGANLPPGSAVMTRKPSIFYVLSGLPSRMFPFVVDPDAHLALAEEMGARYVLVDRWDVLAGQYVEGALRRMPGAFCVVENFGERTILLGILPPEARGNGLQAGGTAFLRRCPAGYKLDDARLEPPMSPSRIPLLEGL